MSILASFSPAIAAAMLSQPGAGDGYYRCDDSVRWGSYYQASATTIFGAEDEDRRTARLQLSWLPDPSGASLVSATWARLPWKVESLPAPDELGFGIRTERLRSGTILLIPPQGEVLSLPVKKPAVRNLKNSGTAWVTIADPVMRSRLTESGGWRFAAVDSAGKVAAQGPINLPDRAGMEIRYRPLAESLRAKAADYDKACVFEPETDFR